MNKIKFRLGLLVVVLVAVVMAQRGDTAFNRMESANLLDEPRFSTLTFEFQQATKYKLELDYSAGTIKVIVPSTNLNPALEFLAFEDDRVETVKFYMDGTDSVAEIILKSKKTSVYHSLSKDGLIVTVHLKTREKLLALKSDITKAEALAEKRKREKEFKEKLQLVLDESGKGSFMEAMEEFQKLKFRTSFELLDAFVVNYPNSIYLEKAYFIRAEALYRHSKKKRLLMPDAIEAFKLAVVRFPGSERIPRARLRMGDLYLDQKLDIEASATYDNIISAYPDSKFLKSAYLGKASVFMLRKKYDAAFNELERILLLYPRAKEVRGARFKIAEALYFRKRYKTALNLFEDSNRKWPSFLKSNSTVMDHFADTYFQLGRFDEALRIYTELYNLFPDSEEGRAAINRSADIYVKKGNNGAALRVLGVQVRRDVEGEPGLESRLRLASLGHAKKKMVDEKTSIVWDYPDYFHPMETYNDIINKVPGTKQARDAMFQKARLFNLQKRYIDSVYTLKEMMKEYKETRVSGPVLRLVQDSLFKLIRDYHDQEGYLTILTTYVENFDPFFTKLRNPEILMKVGDAYFEMGLFKRAVKKYERAEELDRQLHFKERLVFGRGRALTAMRKFSEAEEALMPFTDIFDNSTYAPDALHLLGDVFYAQGKNKKASRVFSRAIFMAPENGRVSETAYKLGVLSKNNNRFDDAIEYFRMSVDTYKTLGEKEDPFFVQESNFRLVESLYKVGMYADAIQVAEKAVKKYPEHAHNNWARYIMSDSQVKISRDEKAIKSLQALAEDQAGTIYGKVASATVANNAWKLKHKDLFAN